MKIQTTPLTLYKTKQLTDSVRHFVFDCPNEKMLNFTPGQFITMHLPLGDKVLRRSYSIANQNTNKYIEFSAGFVPQGPATELLFSLKPGDQIKANGPFGRLVLKDEPVSRYFLVATSTGITPYLSMLQALSKQMVSNSELEVHILQGVRTQNDLLYLQPFKDFCHQHKRAFFYACYSRQEQLNNPDYEYDGYVQTKLQELSPYQENDITYLCGNPAMVDACFQQLTDNHVDIKRIRREKYISK